MVSTPNTTGTPVSSETRGDARRALPRHEVEVRRVAPDHRAEADRPRRRAGRGEPLRDQRDLERARHPVHRDLGEAGVAQRAERAPSSSGLVMWSLKRPATIAMRIPVASSAPSYSGYVPMAVRCVL